ncbi:MAG TPA: hypothetical protein VJB05_01835 [archaeon]|nr:hypothetical protein [archaeon]
MKQQMNLLDEIEDIKARLTAIETTLIETEEPEKGDMEAIKEALAEHKKSKTILYRP